MSIKDTYKHLKELVAHISVDLDKSENGNKAASQRVRTGTVKLEKVAKLFRKESILHEKKTKGQKPAKASSAKKAVKKVAKPVAKKPVAVKSKNVAVKAKPKAKAAQGAAHVKSRHMSIKRAPTKAPVKNIRSR